MKKRRMMERWWGFDLKKKKGHLAYSCWSWLLNYPGNPYRNMHKIIQISSVYTVG